VTDRSSLEPIPDVDQKRTDVLEPHSCLRNVKYLSAQQEGSLEPLPEFETTINSVHKKVHHPSFSKSDHDGGSACLPRGQEVS
jgi:hypothetical protein